MNIPELSPELTDLAVALGLLTERGGTLELDSDWFTAPGASVATALADAHRRNALVRFVETTIGEGDHVVRDGVTLLPLLSIGDLVDGPAPDLRFMLSLDDQPTDHVAVGLAVSFSTPDDAAHVEVAVPIYRAGKRGETAIAVPAEPFPLLDGAPFDVGFSLRTGDGTPDASGFGLREVAVAAAIPVADLASTTLRLDLLGLRLPGSTEPVDIRLGGPDADLEDVLLGVVLGIVRAGAGSLGGAGAAGMAALDLLGLGDDPALPPLDIADLLSRGVDVVRDWFTDTFAAPTARRAWLSRLATLVGGGVVDDELEIPLPDSSPVAMRLGLDVVDGADGHRRVTPRVRLVLATTGAVPVGVAARVDLFTINTSNGSLSAVPRVEVDVRCGDDTTPLIENGPVQVGVGRFGLSVIEGIVRPLIRLENCDVRGTPHPVLDLSNADAVAATAGNIAADLLATAIAALGPAGAHLTALLGLSPPTGVSAIDAGRFLSNPLEALAAWWERLLADHASEVPEVLGHLRDLIATDGLVLLPVDGDGTADRPWHIALAERTALECWRDGDDLVVAPTIGFRADTLGEGCTVVTSHARVELIRIDLARRQASMLRAVEFDVAARARGAEDARLAFGPVAVTAEHIGLRTAWNVATGFAIELDTPGLQAVVDGEPVPLALPHRNAAGDFDLTAEAWAAVEHLIAVVARSAPFGLLDDVVALAGWTLDSDALHPLSLAALADDPSAALRDWVRSVFTDESTVLDLANVTARILTGSPDGRVGGLFGVGSADDPLTLPLGIDAAAPALTLMLGSDGPARSPVGGGHPIETWVPGLPGFEAAGLADAVFTEAAANRSIADLASGRGHLADGLTALTARLAATDGLVAAPPTDLPGVATIRDQSRTWDQWAALGPGEIFGGVPDATAAILHVAVATPPTAPWPDVPTGRLIDLSAPGLAPESFTLADSGPGEWFVTLASRSDAALASGDPDGLLGQAGRLRRIVDAFDRVGTPINIAAHSGAGHCARLVADAVDGVTKLATLGTPWSPVAFETVRSGAAADTVRLLKSLLPDVDPGEPDDDQLALGRSLVDGLIAAAGRSDDVDVVDLAAPLPELAPRAGLAVRAWFGDLPLDDVRSALTAVVAAGMWGRVAADAASAVAAATGADAAFSIPFDTGAGGLRVRGSIDVGLVGSDLDASIDSLFAARPTTRLRLRVSDSDGWLVGGPGAPIVADALPIDLREIEFTVAVGGGTGSANVVLLEGSAFGVMWDRLPVRPNVDVTGDLDETPLLPEARAVLAALMTRLRAATGGSPGTLLADLFDAAGLSVRDVGFVPDAMAHLLHDPAGFVRGIVGEAAPRTALLAAIAALVPGLTAAGGVVQFEHPAALAALDLATQEISINARSAIGGHAWTFDVDGIGGDAPSAVVTVGRGGLHGISLRIATTPLRVDLQQTTTDGALDVTELWPTPNVDGLSALISSYVGAEAIRLVLEGIRPLDETVDTVVTALAESLGVLEDVDGLAPAARRRIAAPLALLAEPADWMRTQLLERADGGGGLARVEALFESIKPFVGMESSPRGRWDVAPGVAVTVRAGGSGPRVGIALDPTAWLGAASRPPFAAGLAVDLMLVAGAPPVPKVAMFAGLPGDGGAAPSTVHVNVEGGGIDVFLRRPGTGDLALYPNPAGLGDLLTAGAEALLPLVLDELAELDGERADIGRFVGAFGRGLGVAAGGETPGSTASFSGSDLRALVADPTARLETRATALIAEVATALDTLVDGLPGVTAVSVDAAGRLVGEFRGMRLAVDPSPLSVSISGATGRLDSVGDLSGTLTFDRSGVTGWSLQAGPGELDIGGPALRPVLAVSADDASGWQVDLGLGLDELASGAVGRRELLARWSESGGLTMIATEVEVPDIVVERSDAEAVATAAVVAIVDLLGAWVLSVPDVVALLDRPVDGTTARALLSDSLLSADGSAIRGGLIDDVPGSLFALARRLATSLPPVSIHPFTIGLRLADGDVLALELGLLPFDGGLALTTGDVVLSLVGDAEWIEPPSGASPAPGLQIRFITVPPTLGDPIEIAPGVAVNGLGLRVAGSVGPLLDAGVRLEAAAVHGFGSLQHRAGSGLAVSGGIQVELDGLSVPLGAGGGENAVAQGILSDAGDGGTPPAPGFSPALAVQAHDGGEGVAVSLRAGSGDGPWYLPIQRAFGPVYLEQIGLGVGYDSATPRKLEWISLSLDGSVSLLGLTASVDKLRLTYRVSEPIFEVTSWVVDVDGFAIASDVGGLTLVGGLRKTPLTPAGSGDEYIGMLKIAFGGYGLSLFGGYAEPTGSDGSSYASFFAFGVLLAPLGGPPAFFITGIGLGFGINRALEPPTVETLDDNVFLNALRAVGPAPEPMAQLEQLRSEIVPQRGQHWVAAGISFTSFVLITGEVVVVVQFGDGLDIALLGLARVQLPGPAPAALVSIELALLARFSSKEGSLLVQAQLTENSWLLHPSVRLTGGFAFATWWKGPNAGQFVVTIGGYHPRFRADGYPVVPRVGINWSPSSNVVVKGESYFALCSEAIMAGTSIEASARFGPAYARLSFGGDGIVYFDPFWFSVSAHAEVAAGIRIWLLFGTVDIEVSLGVEVEVSGPPIYIEGRFKICGFTVPFEIGDRGDDEDAGLTAGEFERKYLRADAGARPIQATVVKGATRAGRSTDGSTDKVPDGTIGLPFLLTPEFEVTVLTTVPMTAFSITRPKRPDLGLDDEEVVSVSTPAAGLGLAPMKGTLAVSTLTMILHKRDDDNTPYSIDAIQLIRDSKSSFPKGVWGLPQDRSSPRVPEGKVVHAEDTVTLRTTLLDSMFIERPSIDYHQVELPLDGRKPLPFVTDTARVNERRAAAAALRDIADGIRPDLASIDERYLVAASLLSVDGAQPMSVAALRGERTATPGIASLADDLRAAPEPVSTVVEGRVLTPIVSRDVFVAPHVRAIMTTPGALAIAAAPTTTVASAVGLRRQPPTLHDVRARLSGNARSDLIVREFVATAPAETIVADSLPLSRLATMPVAAVANARATVEQQRRVEGASDGFRRGELMVAEGDVVVVAMGSSPGENTDVIKVAGGPTRIVAMAPGGRVLDDIRLGVNGVTTSPVPAGADRLAVVPLGAHVRVGGALAGWYTGQSLPLLGWDLALAGGATVRFHDNKARRNRERRDGGWANTADLVHASRIVTRFDEVVTAVAIAIDDGPDESFERFEISLIGATRVQDGGVDRLPRVLADGVRSVLVFDIEPDDTGDVSVVVDQARQVRIGGLLGTQTDGADLERQLLAHGFEAAVRAPIRGGGGRRTVAWTTTREDN